MLIDSRRKTPARVSPFTTAAVLAGALLLFSSPALAANAIVGTGTPASCTETALRNALFNPPGGTVSFNCGVALADIEVTQTLVITSDTTILGGGRIRIKRSLLASPFGLVHVGLGVTVTLQGLKLDNGGGGPIVPSDPWFETGGGLYNEGTTNLDQVQFSGNAATLGGAVANLGTLIVYNSTFTGNKAQGTARDIFNSNFAGAGTLTVVNSTFDTASSGVSLINNNSSMTLLNTTVSGAATLVIENSGTLSVRNTVLAKYSGLGQVCGGSASVTTLGHNLSTDNSCGLQGSSADIVNTDPMLGSLANNGSSTPTRLPLSGSPVIDAGDTSAGPGFDQRGVQRPQGAATDIGAVEFVPPQSWYVAVAGDDANPCNTKAAPCHTINAAIAKAANFDSIYVTNETFPSGVAPEGVNVTKSLLLSGGWNAAFDTKIGVTTLLGAVGRRGVTVSYPATVTMHSFVVRGARITLWDGGGAYIAGSLTGSDLVFEDNRAERGGGVYVGAQGSIDLQRIGIYRNQGRYGAGVFLDYGSGVARLKNATIAKNGRLCDLCTVSGAGVYSVRPNPGLRLEFCTVAENATGGPGGEQIYIGDPNGVIKLLGTVIADSCGAKKPSSLGGNFEQGNTCGLTDPTDEVNRPPGLDPLQINGGYSETYAIDGWSGPTNSGPIAGPLEDQRGAPRPGNGRNDTGAYEYHGVLWKEITSYKQSFMLGYDVLGENGPGGVKPIGSGIELLPSATEGFVHPSAEYTPRESPTKTITLGKVLGAFDVRVFSQDAAGNTIEQPRLRGPMTLTTYWTSESGFGPSQIAEFSLVHLDRNSQSWQVLSTQPDPLGLQQATTQTLETGQFAVVLLNDTDGDGIQDPVDNCVTVENPDQNDRDFDRVGDACDCAADDRGSFALPAEVAGLQFSSDKVSLFWQPLGDQAGSETFYEVRRTLGGEASACFPPIGTTVIRDPAIPAPGTSFQYLTRGRNACGAGTWGLKSDGNDRPAPQCP